MNLPATLDVALGLIVLYFLLSTICSFVVELIATYRWWRKTLLYKTIGRLITGKDHEAPTSGCIRPKLTDHSNCLLEQFWTHPLIKALAPDDKLPSYIEPSTFAAVVIDLAVPGATNGTLPTTSDGVDRVIRLAAESAPEAEWQLALKPEGALTTEDLRFLRQTILTAFRACGLNRPDLQETLPVDDLRRSIEKLYNEAMERLKGQYKRRTQAWLFGIGLFVTLLLNADTIRTVYVLSTNDSLRTATATYAATLAADTNALAKVSTNVFEATNTNEVTAAQIRTNVLNQINKLQNLQQLGFPLGWGDEFSSTLNYEPYEESSWIILFKAIGLLMTAFAISMGAPFWYDLLNRLASLRGSGSRIVTDESEKKKSEAATARTIDPQKNPMAGAPAKTEAPKPADFVKDIGDGRLEFTARKGYWMAEAALLAYSAKEPVQAAVQQWGLNLVHHDEKVQACQWFLAISSDKKVALLAFRGTEKKLEDWHTDAEFNLVSSPTGAGETHAGFTKQLSQVYDEIAKKLKENLGSDTLLYLTGHSLGAALATLMAARLATSKAAGVHAVLTFGSPRVGDRDFAKQYELALGHCTYRVVNGEDLVTRVPPRYIPRPNDPAWKYDHVGQVVFFDSDGRMHLNAGFWQRFLNTVINAVADFRNQLKSSLRDHSMDLYVRLLKMVTTNNK
jgi:triacylglycerol lipase